LLKRRRLCVLLTELSTFKETSKPTDKLVKTGPSHASSMSGNNLTEYERSAASGGYAGEPKLKKAEEAILRRIADEVRSVPILDLGVGAGRTVPFLNDLSKDYLGLDYSAEMVAVCRRCYPGIRIIHGDARDLSALPEEHFGFVCFAWNGMDCVAHNDRQRILAEILRVLRPGGLFLFASHNLNCKPRQPWDPALHYWTRDARGLVRYVYYSLRWTWQRFRRLRWQRHGDNYSILVDELHDFCLLCYFVTPSEQVRQLKEHGFEDIKLFDADGKEGAADAPFSHSATVYYLARRPR
jgi:SAM-dependent methyltransferase